MDYSTRGIFLYDMMIWLIHVMIFYDSFTLYFFQSQHFLLLNPLKPAAVQEDKCVLLCEACLSSSLVCYLLHYTLYGNHTVTLRLCLLFLFNYQVSVSSMQKSAMFRGNKKVECRCNGDNSISINWRV